MKKETKKKEPRSVYQRIEDIEKALVIILEDMKERDMAKATAHLANRRYREPRVTHYREAVKQAREEVERKYKVLKNLRE
jgi:hypothetical protein